MRIAQIAPLAESVPPKLYGGTERVVSYLTEELVRQKHEVTLFASGESKTKARLVKVVPQALRLNDAIQNQLYYHLILLDRVRQEADNFDLLHFHIDAIHLPLIQGIRDKTLTTLHGRLDLPDLVPLYKVFSRTPLVSISASQRKPMPPVRWLGTVPHGLPVSLYKPQLVPGKYLAFLGRISPEKGLDQAIEIAERVNMPLKIAAKIDPSDKAYFEERIRPLLKSTLVEFVGEISDAEKGDFLGGALALLFPIDWPEPFGLTMIEAMANGTPVIAYNQGSVPEVVEHGVAGFVVRDVAEAAAAIGRISSIDRAGVRAYFEKHFTVEQMVQNYLSIYDRLVSAAAPVRKQASHSLSLSST